MKKIMKNNTDFPRLNRRGRFPCRILLFRILLLGSLLAAVLGGRAHAGVIWVEGKEECLAGLCYTDQMDDRPLILFSETAPASPDLLQSLSAIVLCRSSWKDLVLDFLPALASLRGRQTLNIPEDNEYEIYVKRSSPGRGEAFLPFVSVDGKEIKTQAADPQSQSRLYHRVAGVFLEKGDHAITCAADVAASFYLVCADALAKTEEELLEVLRGRDVRFSFITDQPQGTIAFPETPSAGFRYPLRVQVVFSRPPVAGEEKEEKKEEGEEEKEEEDRTSDAGRGRLKMGSGLFALEDMPEARSVDLSLLTQTFTPEDNETPFHLSGHTLALRWLTVEPTATGPTPQEPQTPTLFVRRYSPSKYFVRVRGGQDPFWLILGERYHQLWRLYAVPKLSEELFSTVNETFRPFNVQESEPTALFDGRDLGYLFKKTVRGRHVKVNGFANGWLIDPAEENLGEDFDLAVFFWPQSFLYLGMLLTGLASLCTLSFLFFRRRKRP